MSLDDGRDMIITLHQVSQVVQTPSCFLTQGSRTAGTLPGKRPFLLTHQLGIETALTAVTPSFSFPRRETTQIPLLASHCTTAFFEVSLLNESLYSKQISLEANEHLPGKRFKHLGYWIIGHCVMTATRGLISANCNARLCNLDNCPVGTELGPSSWWSTTHNQVCELHWSLFLESSLSYTGNKLQWQNEFKPHLAISQTEQGQTSI